MTLRSAIKAVVEELPKTDKSPIDLSRTTFKGDPATFLTICREWAAESGAYHGRGKMTSAQSDLMSSDFHTAFELYGDVNDGTKRPLPRARVWIEARSHPARPGEGAPHTSQLGLTMKSGEWSVVAEQVLGVLGFLRANGWLDESAAKK